MQARRTRQGLSRVWFLCRWHVRLVTEHDEKSVHGRARPACRLLTEAKDYSPVESNVNGYFSEERAAKNTKGTKPIQVGPFKVS